jgi:hypothetical protein
VCVAIWKNICPNSVHDTFPQEYRAELEGLQREDRFDIFTDRRALEYFMTTKALNPRQANRAEYLSRFRFMIRYRPGIGNTSRREEIVQQ